MEDPGGGDVRQVLSVLVLWRLHFGQFSGFGPLSKATPPTQTLEDNTTAVSYPTVPRNNVRGDTMDRCF